MPRLGEMALALPADLIVRAHFRAVTGSRMLLHVQALVSRIEGRCYSHPAARSHNVSQPTISRLGGGSLRSVALLLFLCCKSHRCLSDVITEIDLPCLAFLCNKAQQRFAHSQRFHHDQFCFSI